MQPAVDSGQGDVSPERFFRDPLEVLALEDADLVRRRRIDLKPGLQSLGPYALDRHAVAVTLASADRLDAAVAVGVDRMLDAGAASRERFGDGERLTSLDRPSPCSACDARSARALSLARIQQRRSITNIRTPAE